MKRLYGSDYLIEKKYKKLQKELKEQVANRITWNEVFNKYRKPLLICLFVIFAVLSNGIHVLLFYSNQVFQESVSLETATLLSNILFLCTIIGNIVCLYIANSYGRKIILSTSFLTLGILYLLFAVSYQLDNAFWFRVVVLNIASFVIGVGHQPFLWIVLADYLPVKAMSVALLLFHVLMFMVGILFPIGLESIGLSGMFYLLSFF